MLLEWNIIGGLSLVGMGFLLGWRFSKKRLENQMGRSRAGMRYARQEMWRLREEIDSLSAVREIGLISNGDSNQSRIINEILPVLATTLHANEVTLYLWSRKKGLRPAGIRRNGKNLLKSEFMTEATECPLVHSALEDARTMRGFESGKLTIATLIAADREISGVIKIVVPVQGKDEGFLERVETRLENLAGPVALALKKPALYAQAVMDGLTGLYTKRHFIEEFEQHLAKSQRLGRPLSLILLDLDHFKNVNDTHGHLTGDRVLRQTADVIRQTIREYDLAFRYGGEEMAVLAPESDIEDATALAERIRIAISEMLVYNEDGEEFTVTTSIGVAAYKRGIRHHEELISAADKALYDAKKAGRNKVCVAKEVIKPLKKAKKPKKTQKQKKAKKVA